MNQSRKAVLGLTTLTVLFVFGAAVVTGNSALFILAALAGLTTVTLWLADKRAQ